MRKSFTLCFLLALVCVKGWGQVVNYNFPTPSSSTYTNLTAGADVESFSGWDDNVYPVSIPFSFTFNGTAYSSINVSSNGFITFGSTAPSATTYNPISSAEGYAGAIAGISRDLLCGTNTFTGTWATGATTLTVASGTAPTVGTVITSPAARGLAAIVTNVSGTTVTFTPATTGASGANAASKTVTKNSAIVTNTVGSAPNRKFYIQWIGADEYNSSTSSGTGSILNFQIILNETTNVVNINYGSCTSTFSTTASVGLRGASNTDFKDLTGSNWSSPSVGSSNASVMTLSGTSFPALNLLYTASPPPLLTASTLTVFGAQCINNTYGPNSFTITGTNLTTANVTVAALNGYTYSTTSGGTYTTTLSIPQTGGSFSQQIFVKFTPTAVQNYNGNIAVGGGGASSINVAASGSGLNSPPTVSSGTATGLTLTSATVSGSISSTGCTPITAYGIEYSTTNNFANGTGTQVPATNLSGNNFSANLTGLTQGTTYYFHAYATNSNGTGYGGQGTFTTPIPTLTTGTITAFGNVCINTTAGPNSFTITGTNLTTADVTVAALNGYTYSTTSGGTYTTTLTIPQPGGSFSQTIFVKFTPVAVQSYNGNIVVGGGGAANKTVAASGSGVNTVPTVTSGTATSVTIASATVSGTISSAGCTAVTAYGIEYSTTNNFVNGSGTQVPASNLSGGNFSSSLTGLTPSTTYYFHAYATNDGGTGYGGQGTFTTPTPTLTASALTAFGAQCINNTYGPNSFTITGTNLTTANVTVGALSGYTYSTTSGGTYTTTLSIPQPGGSFSQQIFVKFTPTAVQNYNGNIAVGGGGATSTNVAASGSGVNTVPAVTNNSVSVTSISATISATLSSTGCTAVTAYGVEYSTTNGFANGTGTPVAGGTLSGGNFSTTITGLTPNTNYYYHVFATNGGGTGYSTPQGSFTTATPTLAVSPTSLAFGAQCINNVYGPSTFTITGTNLATANVTVAALNGYTYSTTSGGTYTTTLSIPQPSGAFSQAIFVKFSPIAVQAYNGNITVSGGGAPTSRSVAVTGSGVNTVPGLTAGGASSITTISATVSGTISATGCTAVTAYGIEYSTTNNFANGSGIQVPASNLTGSNFSVDLTGLTPGTIYYYHAFATNGGGTGYSTQGSFTTTPLSITTGTITGSPFCAGESINVPFTSVGTTYTSYTAQLSNASGSFVSPTNIGTSNTTANSGTIAATIPASAAPGTGYLIRVISTNPAVTGSSSSAITINALPTITGVTPASATVCSGANVSLTAVSPALSLATAFSDNFDGTPLLISAGTVSGNQSQTWGQETSGTNVNGIATFTSPGGGKLMVALSAATVTLGTSAATTLTSPAINTNNYSSLTLTYNHTYKQGNSSGAGTVEVSTDGGSSWSVLQTYNTNQGGSTSFVTGTINLSNTYLNQSNLKIRFNFNSANGASFGTVSSWWAVDNVALNGVPVTVFSWIASPSVPAAGLPVSAGSFNANNKSIIVTPTNGNTVPVDYTYTVTAQNPLSGCTSVTTGNAIVTVNPITAITSQPISYPDPLCEGTPITFSVSATGANLTYQWHSTTSPNANPATDPIVPDADGGKTSTINVAVVSGTTNYYVVVAGSCGTLTSNLAAVSSVAIRINSQPLATQTKCQNTTATALSPSIGGNDISFQWYVNTTNSNTGGTPAPGVNNLRPYSPPTNVAGIFYYYLVITSDACDNTTATTNTAQVIVNPPTAITGNPSTSPQTVCQNTPATQLTVTAVGGNLHYQWYSNSAATNTGGTAVGTDAATYTPATTTPGTLYYYVVVTGSCTPTSVPSEVSGGVTVTPATAITGQPQGATYCEGNTVAALSVGATGTGTITYQWYINTTNSNSGGSLINGAISASYTPSVTVAGIYYYYVVVGSDCGAAQTSSVATVKINTTPTASISPVTGSACEGSTVGITIAATPGSIVTYTTDAGTSPVTFTMPPSGNYPIVSPSNVGVYHYTITDVHTSSCPGIITEAQSTVTINPNPTLVLSSGTASQTQCGYDGITPIVYTFGGGATGVNVNISPSNLGITYTLGTNTVTISGTPTTTGVINYSITTTGGSCGSAGPLGGTITVTPYAWNGTIDRNWNNADNWCGGIPANGANVTIGATPNDPILPTGTDVTVGELTIANNATVTLSNDRTLTINGVITGTGTLSTMASSNLVTNATTAVNFTPASHTLHNLSVTGGTLTLGNALDITAGLTPGIVTVANGAHLTVGTGAVMTLKSDPDGTAAVAANTSASPYIDGTVTAERYISDAGQAGGKRAWRLLTAPIGGTSIKAAWQEGQTSYTGGPAPASTGYGTIITGEAKSITADASFDYLPGTQHHTSIEQYNAATRTWGPLSSNASGGTTVSLRNEPAYMLFIRGDRSKVTATGRGTTVLRATGSLVQGAQQPLTVSTVDAFTLSGNPYAAPLDFAKIYGNASNAAAIQNEFYVWDAHLGDYGGYVTVSDLDNNGTYESTPIALNETTTVTQNIQSGEGFFVVPTTTGGNLMIDETMKKDDVSTGTGSTVSPFRVVQATDVRQLLVNLNLKSDTTATLSDGFRAKFSADYEGNEEDNSSIKASNMYENLGLVRNGINHIVEARGEVRKTDTLQLKLWSVSYRSYELQMKGDNFTTAPGLRAWLEDSYLQTRQEVDLSGGITTVGFEVNKDSGSWKSTRFRIVFENTATVLPVTITKVSAQPKNGGAEVSWTVSNEVNVKGYTVEKAADGRTFTGMGTQQPAKNNPQAALTSYSGYDATPQVGDNYYRIRIEGSDGKISYSEIVKVTIGNTGTGIRITLYPNPVREGKANLVLTNLKEGSYLVSVFSGSGQTVYQKKVTVSLSGTTQSEPLLLGKTLAQGSYPIRVTDSRGTVIFTDKLIVGR